MSNSLQDRIRNRFDRQILPMGFSAAGKLLRWRSPRPIRRVVHVSPAYFDPKSYIGGGERYPTSLARAMADLIDTRLVTFGPHRDTIIAGSLTIELYPFKRFIGGQRHDPYARNFLREIYHADAVHCHQYTPFVTTLSILAASALGRPTVVTDLGGEGWNANQSVQTHKLVNRFCPISHFAIRDFEQGRSTVIHGGVSAAFLDTPPAGWPRKNQVLFVGRLLPHKGINYLVEAIPPDVDLLIMGPPYHAEYLQHLKVLAEGKRVKFITDATDEQIATAYRESILTVLPSVYVDCYGTTNPRSELLGLTLLESQACGTPAMCTAVGGMPEFVEDGITGYIVPPNDPGALRQRIVKLLDDSLLAQRLGLAGRRMVETRFTWRRIAEKCIQIYSAYNSTTAN
jgi:glycosyltransferase involved in cell wall biosynthesis